MRYTATEAATFGVNIEPAVARADFETAIHIYVTTVCPGYEVKVWDFHISRIYTLMIFFCISSTMYCNYTFK